MGGGKNLDFPDVIIVKVACGVHAAQVLPQRVLLACVWVAFGCRNGAGYVPSCAFGNGHHACMFYQCSMGNVFNSCLLVVIPLVSVAVVIATAAVSWHREGP